MNSPTRTLAASLRPIFCSAGEPRLRLGWRLAGFVAIYFLSQSAARQFSRYLDYVKLATLSSEIITLLTITLAVFVARRLLDRRSFASLGLGWDRWAIPDGLAGILIGGVMMALIFGLAWAGGWVQIQSFTWRTVEWGRLLRNVNTWLAIYAIIAWEEELLYRGYLLKNLAAGLPRRLAVLLSALIFAAMHYSNAAMNLESLLVLFLLGGLLALAALRTGRLWLAMGLHLGWNSFQGVVFGFRVSGHDTFRLIQQTTLGPAWLTGGPFGAEAGALALAGLALGGALILGYTWRRQASSEKAYQASRPIQEEPANLSHN